MHTVRKMTLNRTHSNLKPHNAQIQNDGVTIHPACSIARRRTFFRMQSFNTVLEGVQTIMKPDDMHFTRKHIILTFCPTIERPHETAHTKQKAKPLPSQCFSPSMPNTKFKQTSKGSQRDHTHSVDLGILANETTTSRLRFLKATLSVRSL